MFKKKNERLVRRTGEASDLKTCGELNLLWGCVFSAPRKMTTDRIRLRVAPTRKIRLRIEKTLLGKEEIILNLTAAQQTKLQIILPSTWSHVLPATGCFVCALRRFDEKMTFALSRAHLCQRERTRSVFEPRVPEISARFLKFLSTLLIQGYIANVRGKSKDEKVLQSVCDILQAESASEVLVYSQSFVSREKSSPFLFDQRGLLQGVLPRQASYPTTQMSTGTAGEAQSTRIRQGNVPLLRTALLFFSL